MKFTTALLLAFSATGLAAPGSEIFKRQSTPNSSGMHDGFFYSWWSDGGSQATYTNLAGGKYSVRWGSGGNLVGGKGWKPGSNSRVISYSGTYNYNGNSYLAIYGWTTNPLIEYYIVENWGNYNPASDAQGKGSITYDGSVYDLGVSTRVNKPSIIGDATFQQFWAVRRNKRTGGTINFQVFVDAWRNAGMNLGSHDYQIVATEGYFSTGNSEITVREGSSGGTNPPPSSTTQGGSQPTGNPGGNCSALYGQCGGQGWNGPTCCSSGTCRAANQWYSQCL